MNELTKNNQLNKWIKNNDQSSADANYPWHTRKQQRSTVWGLQGRVSCWWRWRQEFSPNTTVFQSISCQPSRWRHSNNPRDRSLAWRSDWCACVRNEPASSISRDRGHMSRWRLPFRRSPRGFESLRIKRLKDLQLKLNNSIWDLFLCLCLRACIFTKCTKTKQNKIK